MLLSYYGAVRPNPTSFLSPINWDVSIDTKSKQSSTPYGTSPARGRHKKKSFYDYACLTRKIGVPTAKSS